MDIWACLLEEVISKLSNNRQVGIFSKLLTLCKLSQNMDNVMLF